MSFVHLRIVPKGIMSIVCFGNGIHYTFIFMSLWGGF